jgi:putative copper export protein
MGERGELPTPGEIVARWLALLGAVLFLGVPLFYTWVVVGQEADNSAVVDDIRALVLKAIWVAALAIVLGGWLQIILLTLRLGEMTGLPGLLLGTRTGVLGLARQVVVLTGLLLVQWRLAPARSGREPAFWLEVAVYQFVVLVLLAGAIFNGEWEVAGAAYLISVLGLAPLIRTPSQTRGEGLARHLLLFLGATLLFSFSLGSHAGAAPGWAWAVAGDFLHFLAAAAWLGGLASLAWLILRAKSGRPFAASWPFVQRFSRLATLAVFVLIVTGLFNSLVQLPSLASLLETTYGRVLLAKLILTGLVLGVAFLNNRLVHRHAYWLHEPGVGQRFQRQVALEAVFSLGLMLSVAVLVQTSKPASVAADTAPPSQIFDSITQADDLYIHTQVLPNQVGQNLFLVHLYHEDDSPIGEVQLVRLFFNYQEAQLGQAQADLEPWEGDIFRVEGAYLNQAGLWKLSVYVRRRGMDDILTDISLEVPGLPDPAADANPWQNPLPDWSSPGLWAQ